MRINLQMVLLQGYSREYVTQTEELPSLSIITNVIEYQALEGYSVNNISAPNTTTLNVA